MLKLTEILFPKEKKWGCIEVKGEKKKDFGIKPIHLVGSQTECSVQKEKQEKSRYEQTRRNLIKPV